ncbi:MAG: 1-aminocyclopropane-1-carboxylate deaminase/D-cysteine desulfhydrase [Cytophagaceae bacterium]
MPKVQHISSINGVHLFLKREDLIHPNISGNKWWKLKYNLEQAKKEGKDTILTFGGAYSNHIHATAAAGKEFGMKTIGIIRGEELNADNSTLKFAESCGMKLVFISREQYRQKETEAFLKEIDDRFNHPYIVPEGGSNVLALKGCMEMMQNMSENYDFYCCAAGTGATMAGITAYSGGENIVLGFSSLKDGAFLADNVSSLLVEGGYNYSNYEIITDYHFGGYGKVTKELVLFINDFKRLYSIQLDPVYTAKMMFGIMDLINRGFFPHGSRILAVHTGGIQGIDGYREKFKFE